MTVVSWLLLASVAVVPRPKALLVLGQGDVVHTEAQIRAWVRENTTLDLLRYDALPASAESGSDCHVSNLDCFAQRARERGADLLLLVDRTSGTFLITRNVLSSGHLSIEHVSDLEAGLEIVTPARYRHPARLWIPDPARVVARLQGEPCVIPCAFERLPAGHYTVRVGERTEEISLEEGQDLTLRFAEANESSLWKSPWLWGAVSVALAGAVATAVVVADSSSAVRVRASGP